MTALTDARSWHGEQLDLDAYLDRVDYHGDTSPTLSTLRALHRAHVTNIPFENLEMVLGRAIPLDVESLQDKMVRRPRGGYCYEHSKLFAAALERLGFSVWGLAARVRVGTDLLRPATHALLRVGTDETPDTGRTWICDVGFGRDPLEPVELADGTEITPDGWRFRLERQTPVPGAEEWMLRSLGADGWFDMHGFTLDPRYAVDYTVANHYMSTHPSSPFANRLLVQQMGPGALYALAATELTATHPDGTVDTWQLKADEVPQTLADVFRITLPEEDMARVVAAIDGLRR
ncbi:arylamine N-acetyltransferase family protein [Streptomyces sp. RPT161]|uniref:arylamine N-acetyltransferase family protein n=1 Tax=Streptomyces sp. RPT161 TaxID=3015993 RepID=UPI0022B8CF6B|nr:arylamine N-acetyltransferase [Streptomyces sp. RPT161]